MAMEFCGFWQSNLCLFGKRNPTLAYGYIYVENHPIRMNLSLFYKVHVYQIALKAPICGSVHINLGKLFFFFLIGIQANFIMVITNLCVATAICYTIYCFRFVLIELHMSKIKSGLNHGIGESRDSLHVLINFICYHLQ